LKNNEVLPTKLKNNEVIPTKLCQRIEFIVFI